MSPQSFSVPGPAPAAEVVEQQGAGISAEWLLQLGGLLCSRAGRSGDLGIARGLVHG